MRMLFLPPPLSYGPLFCGQRLLAGFLVADPAFDLLYGFFITGFSFSSLDLLIQQLDPLFLPAASLAHEVTWQRV